MTYQEFIDTRAKRLQLGAYTQTELMSLMNDAISKIELSLFKQYGECYFLTGLPANRGLLNLSNELSMVMDIFRIDDHALVPLDVYFDTPTFLEKYPTPGEHGLPSAVLVLNSMTIQLARNAMTMMEPFEEFTADMLGGNSRLVLLFNTKAVTHTNLRILGKRGFSRIYKETDSNLLLTDWSDVLLTSLKCVIAEDRSNWGDLKNLMSVLQDKLFNLNRISSQRDAELIGGINASI